MDELRIEIDGDSRTFEPGQVITGRAAWTGTEAPESAELHLFWFTRGKGTRDVAIAAAVPFAPVGASERRPFQVVAPKAPYSFSGKLISLVWGLELILEPGTRVERVEITIAPGGREVVINREREE